MPENKTVRSLLSLRDPDVHSARRRIWNRAFSATALKEYEVVVRNRLTQLVEILTDNSGQSMDLSKWIARLMYVSDMVCVGAVIDLVQYLIRYDVMNDITYGGGVELMRDGDKDGLYAMFEGFLPCVFRLLIELSR